MIGLANGSLIIGKKADEWSLNKIKKFYIFVEVSIGVYALLLPMFIKNLENIYIFSHDIIPVFLWSSVLLKSFFSMLILIVPTFLMGTTLPLITKFLSITHSDYSKGHL